MSLSESLGGSLSYLRPQPWRLELLSSAYLSPLHSYVADICPRIPYLYEDAFQWYPSFDDLGEVIAHPNPAPGVDLLLKVVEYLINECSWPPSNIHLFGFAQGGSVAIETALAYWKLQLRKQGRLSPSSDSSGNSASAPLTANNALGSVVSISGPPILHHSLSGPCPTAVLAFHRSAPSELVLSPDDIVSLRKCFVWVREVKLTGDGMPRSRDEWRLIMEFWSQRLSKRQGEGLYEVLSGMAS